MATIHSSLRFALVTVAALALVVLTAALGRWQLARASYKIDLQARIEALAAQAPLQTADLLRARGQPDAADALLHRRAELHGRWLGQDTVFLDNRQMQGRPGFYVITPLRLGDGAVVLVQRGWVPRNFLERTRLPDIPSPQGDVLVHARLEGPPARLFEFQTSAEADGASRILQNLDLAAYGVRTGLALLPVTALQTDASADGLQRDWPAPDSGVAKHYGYAFQWFGLCALVAMLYVWFQIVRRFIRPRRTDGA